mgnify:CR=1 FL=1
MQKTEYIDQYHEIDESEYTPYERTCAELDKDYIKCTQHIMYSVYGWHPGKMFITEEEKKERIFVTNQYHSECKHLLNMGCEDIINESIY